MEDEAVKTKNQTSSESWATTYSSEADPLEPLVRTHPDFLLPPVPSFQDEIKQIIKDQFKHLLTKKLIGSLKNVAVVKFATKLESEMTVKPTIKKTVMKI